MNRNQYDPICEVQYEENDKNADRKLIALSPDEELLAVGGKRGLKLWDMKHKSRQPPLLWTIDYQDIRQLLSLPAKIPSEKRFEDCVDRISFLPDGTLLTFWTTCWLLIDVKRHEKQPKIIYCSFKL